MQLTFLSVTLSLFVLFLVHLLLGLRRAARSIGSVWLSRSRQWTIDQTFFLVYSVATSLAHSFYFARTLL